MTRQFPAYGAIKIYGERNTGTNYLQQLLALNFDVRLLRGVAPSFINQYVNRLMRDQECLRDLYFSLTSARNLGWKHAMPPDAARLRQWRVLPSDVVFITLTKNPYAWLLSLFQRPYHMRRGYATLEEFLTSGWQTVRRENGPAEFENPVSLWNRKNRAYIELGKSAYAVCNMTYEDLLRDPNHAMTMVAHRFSLVRRQANFKNIEASTKRDTEKDFAFYRSYYLEEQWRQSLDHVAIDIIHRTLDTELMRHFGYVKLQ